MAIVEPINLAEARHALASTPRQMVVDGSSFKGGSMNRLNLDWATRILSADQEIRSSLTAMRARSRELANNNDYAARFLNKVKENVIGPNGIGLQMALDSDLVPNAEKLNETIEDAWDRFCEDPSVDGRMTFVDILQLWLTSQLQDGETFLRKVKGFPHNPFQFGLQFLDPDMVDVSYQTIQKTDVEGGVVSEVRMGIELDEWRRPVAYYVFEGHPSEFASRRRLRVPAEQIEHAFVFKRINQTRGVPWMHSAMTRLNMLRGYEEAELVAARVAACKMAVLTSKTGEDFKGKIIKGGKGGPAEVDVSPASFWQVQEGQDVKPIDWNHPNSGFGDFVKAMLRGAAMGLNMSYSTLTGDLREVNFSSLRQGVLDEREGYRVLQTSAISHCCKPVFKEWLVMAITTGQLQLPAKLPLDMVARAAQWTPRGWDWVDPKKDVDADIESVRAGMNTLKSVAAKRGRDWREDIDQRAKEIQYAKEKGVPIDLTTSGAGGIQGDVADESAPSNPGAGACTDCGALPDGSATNLRTCWSCGMEKE
ncbi:MAG: phage portal protein lambda [Acidobacteriales bacterium]|nr:phage portal protein lambda [Terriglobales bacterium]